MRRPQREGGRHLVAHLPEVVGLVAGDDAFVGQEAPPETLRLLIGRQAEAVIALKVRCIQPVSGELVNRRKQLPRPRDRLVLEVLHPSSACWCQHCGTSAGDAGASWTRLKGGGGDVGEWAMLAMWAMWAERTRSAPVGSG